MVAYHFVHLSSFSFIIFVNSLNKDIINIFCSDSHSYIPHHSGGHIVFSADPVGISVASCLHSISLMNGWILTKLTQIYHWVGENC